MITKPLYIFNGLLDSGKTTVIKETLNDPRFNAAEDTNLIIALEKGEEEYDREFLKATDTTVIYLDSIKDLTLDKMQEIEDAYDSERIILEGNGLEDIGTYLATTGLISSWEIAQILTVVDASLFRMHIVNLRQFMFNHLRISECAIFNRFDATDDYLFIRNNIKAMNPHIELIFEDRNGDILEFAETDIFDMSQDPIVISDFDYGLWYIDAASNPPKYENKHLIINVKFLEDLPQYDEACIMGRRALVCCADDIADIGLTCVGIPKKDIDRDAYYELEGIIHCIDDEEGYKTCLFYVDKVKKSLAPSEDLVTFN